MSQLKETKEVLPNLLPCNNCKAMITSTEFEYGMGECLRCFPKF